LCATPQQIIDRFEPEFEKLVLALCMLPWGQAVDAAATDDWLFAQPVRARRNRSKSSARMR
jgi:hypothetical protein